MQTKKFECPGSQTIRQPVPEDYLCPNCGEVVEVWSNELKHNCPKCGTPVFREAAPSCIDWCQYAKECVGEEAFNRLKGGDKS
ncbi:MAG: hypothetical protein AAB037_00500 [Chloroflexota bacterium]